MSDAVLIESIWLRADTDQQGNETIRVDVEINGRLVTILNERGGVVSQQDNGANISHCVSATGIRQAAMRQAEWPECECIGWERTGEESLGGHHPFCPKGEEAAP
jgi:hypothetical protein